MQVGLIGQKRVLRVILNLLKILEWVKKCRQDRKDGGVKRVWGA